GDRPVVLVDLDGGRYVRAIAAVAELTLIVVPRAPHGPVGLAHARVPATERNFDRARWDDRSSVVHDAAAVAARRDAVASDAAAAIGARVDAAHLARLVERGVLVARRH